MTYQGRLLFCGSPEAGIETTSEMEELCSFCSFDGEQIRRDKIDVVGGSFSEIIFF